MPESRLSVASSGSGDSFGQAVGEILDAFISESEKIGYTKPRYLNIRINRGADA
jgi:hypothetical protein